MPRLSPAAAGLIAVASLLPTASGQCTPDWLPGDPIRTPYGFADSSALWDPDGTGPLPVELVFGGDFNAATSLGAKVITWNGTTWRNLDGLSADFLRALTVHNGELYAATVDGNSEIRRWTGSSWSLFAQPGGGVTTMATYNGQLVVGGSFLSIGGTSVNNIAAWNGTSWSPLGSGIQGTPLAMTVLSGVLYVGGSLTSAGGTPVGNFASWNGAAWNAGPSFNGWVRALAIRSTTAIVNSYVFAAGSFTAYTLPGASTATPVSYCARFAPATSTWTTFDHPNGPIHALSVRSTGLSSYEIAALSPTTGANPSFRVATSTGGAWTTLATAGTAATTEPMTLNYFQGRHTVSCSSTTTAVQSLVNGAWTGVEGQGIQGQVDDAILLGDDLVIGGTFATISGTTVNHLAHGSSGNWVPLGGGVTGTGPVHVSALAKDTNGHLLVGGRFDAAGTTLAAGVARWDGSQWFAYGSGLPGDVLALLPLANGDVLAGGAFQVPGGAQNLARWNGTTWAPLGGSFDGPVYQLASLPDGSVVAGGAFTSAGGTPANNLARWDGSSWLPLGAGTDGPVLATAVTPNGDLYAGGSFTVIGGHLARLGMWSNGVWTPVTTLGLGSASILGIAAHDNGDVFVGGQTFSFSLGPFGSWSTPLLRFRGSTMTPMDVVGTEVRGIAVADDLAMVGSFHVVDGVVSTDVARLHTPCPATATTFGTSCAGHTGPLSLQAPAAAWIGGTLRLEASTFGPSALGILVIGAAPLAVPLDQVFGDAAPGCLASVQPDAVVFFTPVGDTWNATAAIPATPTLVGAVFYAQAGQLESSPTSRTSSSNALALTIGLF